MATCATCGTMILFGGVTNEGLKFCGSPCAEKGELTLAARRVPDGEAVMLASKIHAGPCPKCQKAGPVDLRRSYQVISFIFATNWKTNSILGCRTCGVKAQVTDLFGSLLGGWWGFPWGLVMTPVQIVRNVAVLIKPPSPNRPSEALLSYAKVLIASGRSARD
jgi:hypothetical protein